MTKKTSKAKPSSGAFRDAAGDLRVRRESALAASAAQPPGSLADFLESDLQEDPKRGADLLKRLDQVTKGELKSFETTGNAFTLSVTAKGAKLASLHEDRPDHEITLEELRHALLGWLSAMRR